MFLGCRSSRQVRAVVAPGLFSVARCQKTHFYPPGSRFCHTDQWKQELGVMQRPGNLHRDGMAPPLIINFYLKDGRGIKLLVTWGNSCQKVFLEVAVIQWICCTVIKIECFRSPTVDFKESANVNIYKESALVQLVQLFLSSSYMWTCHIFKC